MKHFSALFAFGVAASAGSQSIPNPGFESDCTFDLSGWNWFCSVPDAFYTDGHNSCYALALPTSDSFDPCFSNGELIGVHSLMSGIQTGVPYQLSLYSYMSSPEVNSDCGLFAMPAGQIPSSFGGGGTLLDTWPVGFSNPGVWMQDIMTFTIGEQYEGMDFYFFIEYSASPDPMPGMKYFDDIAITDLSTGFAGATLSIPTVHPNPATDRVRIDLPEAPLSIAAIDASGRSHDLKNFTYRERALEVAVDALPSGICVLRLNTIAGTRSIRFIKA